MSSFFSSQLFNCQCTKFSLFKHDITNKQVRIRDGFKGVILLFWNHLSHETTLHQVCLLFFATKIKNYFACRRYLFSSQQRNRAPTGVSLLYFLIRNFFEWQKDNFNYVVIYNPLRHAQLQGSFFSLTWNCNWPKSSGFFKLKCSKEWRHIVIESI